MLRVVPVGLAINLALASVGLSGSASAQLPTRSSEPRLAVPRSDLPVAQTPGQPTTAPAAQPGNQATAAASPDTTTAPAPVTQVTGGASGVTQLGGGTSTPPTSSSSYAAISSDKRGYDASKFALTVGGVDAGWLQTFEGGGPSADVVIEKLASDNISHKHLAGVKYDDITISTGLDAKPIMNWIAETWDGKFSRRDGSVLATNFDRKVVAEQQFFHALISETTFPRLDPASKDAAQITVKLTPEYTRAVAGSGAAVPGAPTLQKKWLASSFRFEMDGVDGSRVTRIESFTVSQKVVDHAVGEQRDYEKQPAQLEFPNLKVTLAASNAQTWSNWLNDFVVLGNNGQDKERNGSIVYLSQNLQTELARINLFSCGIFGLEPEKVVAGSDAIRRVTADLYCERMQFVPKAN
jgi:hypothetical protein